MTHNLMYIFVDVMCYDTSLPTQVAHKIVLNGVLMVVGGGFQFGATGPAALASANNSLFSFGVPAGGFGFGNASQPTGAFGFGGSSTPAAPPTGFGAACTPAAEGFGFGGYKIRPLKRGTSTQSDPRLRSCSNDVHPGIWRQHRLRSDSHGDGRGRRGWKRGQSLQHWYGRAQESGGREDPGRQENSQGALFPWDSVD